ncbi:MULTISPECIES: CoA pyrophosphatase [unclassified Methylobacterium]|uniref:CoA pyrophosphatase n=1 Tax=unclassified Methylobacterium TaxID=2615210 RepID=UPI001FB96EA1|nr:MULTISPECIES: CoA pyrophosphatase [unclassified Methylobacterium]MCJ2096263.1 CoA pyrophosphatase [Methylobacterium sp. J-072]MCJ2139725.1 CoA pyrophosphatase [Methylobacterium sp. E-066]
MSDTRADFLARAACHLSPDPPGPDDPTSNPRGDHSLDPDGSAVIPPPPHRRAAVLVPVVFRPAGPRLVLTQRAANLRDHSGQVALPGGKIDPADPGPADAALREAHEEIGLPPDSVRLLGYLDPYLSGTGFLVTPVIGVVGPEATFTPNPTEVADVFEVPLAVLMDRDRYVLHARVWQGRPRRYYAVTFEDRLIWGVTAGILNNLRERLYPETSA